MYVGGVIVLVEVAELDLKKVSKIFSTELVLV